MAKTELLVSLIPHFLADYKSDVEPRPKEFPRFTYEDSDEDSTTGKMPPSDSEDED